MIIHKLLFHLESISIGISSYSGTLRHAVVYSDKNGKKHLITTGNGIPWYIRLLTPVTAHADLLNTPLLVTTEDIGECDPDQWIDKNEKKVIPAGFSSDQVVNEYSVIGSKLFSFTVTTQARDSIINQFGKDISLISLRPPLCALAELYQEYIQQKTFIIWKITAEGSIFGRVEDGKITKLCNFWPDIEDLNERSGEIAKEIEPVISSLSGDSITVPIVVFSPEKNFTFPENLSISGCKLITKPVVREDEEKHTRKIPPAPLNKGGVRNGNTGKNEEIPPLSPLIKGGAESGGSLTTIDIPGVPECDHEVYALACNNQSNINFLPFDKQQKAKNSFELWKSAARWGKRSVCTLLIVQFTLLALHSSVVLLDKFNKESLAGVRKQLSLISEETSKRDSLIAIFKEKAQFIENESTVTNLLSNLQSAFPEGMWAEEISITEIEKNKYRLDIRALAYSSSLIGPCVSNLQKLDGITNTRMVYSEQTSVQKGAKGIRVKIECLWSN